MDEAIKFRANKDIRVVKIGVGMYPEPKPSLLMCFAQKWLTVQLLQKTIEINTQSMDQLRETLLSTSQQFVSVTRLSDLKWQQIC